MAWFKEGPRPKGEKQHHVYRITHPETGEFYIGASTWDWSKSKRRGDIYIGSFQNPKWVEIEDKSVLNKEIIAICRSKEEVYELEEFLIDKFFMDPYCINMFSPKGGFFYNPEGTIVVCEVGHSNDYFRVPLKEFNENAMLVTPLSKKIYQFDIDVNFIKTWNSISQAANFVGSQTSNIARSADLNKDNIYTANYIWRYVEDFDTVEEAKKNIKECIDNYVNPRCSEIDQYSLEGKLINEWRSLQEIKENLNYLKSVICRCLKQKRNKAYDFIWVYKENSNKKFVNNIVNKIKNREYKYHTKSCKIIKTGEVFKSIVELANKEGINRATVSHHCHNKVKNPKYEFVK